MSEAADLTRKPLDVAILNSVVDSIRVRNNWHYFAYYYTRIRIRIGAVEHIRPIKAPNWYRIGECGVGSFSVPSNLVLELLVTYSYSYEYSPTGSPLCRYKFGAECVSDWEAPSECQRGL